MLSNLDTARRRVASAVQQPTAAVRARLAWRPRWWLATVGVLAVSGDRLTMQAGRRARVHAVRGGYTKVWDAAWENPSQIRRAVGYTAAASAFRIAEAFAFGAAVVAAIGSGGLSIPIAIGVATKLTAWYACNQLRDRCDSAAKQNWQELSERTARRIAVQTLEHHRRLSYEQLASEGDGLSQRLNGDVDLVRRTVGERLPRYLSGESMLYGSLAAMWFMAPIMALPITVALLRIRHIMRGAAAENRSHNESVALARQGFVRYYVSRLSPAAGMRDAALGTGQQTKGELEQLGHQAGRTQAEATAVRQQSNRRVLQAFTLAVALSTAAIGWVSPAWAWASILLSSRARQGIEEKANLRLDIADGLVASGRRLQDFFLLRPPVVGVERVDPERPHALSLDRVSYSYPSGRQALSDVSLTIPPGSSVGIVGPSGAGKTTLARVIEGKLFPTEGEARFGDVPTRNIAPQDLRAGFASMTQSGLLMPSLSVKENLVEFAGGLTAGEACRDVGLYDDIMRSPDGFSTPVSQFSGGQQQRIAAAQLLMTPAARIYIVDEPTSALDPVAQARVMDRLWAHTRGRDRSVVIIAHRLSTVRSCDQILYVNDGRVQESGTHDQLMALEGAYAQAFRAEMAGTLDSAEQTRRLNGSVPPHGRTLPNARTASEGRATHGLGGPS